MLTTKNIMRPVTTAVPTMAAAAMPIMPAVLIPDEGLPLEEADALSAVVVGNALVGGNGCPEDSIRFSFRAQRKCRRRAGPRCR